MIGKDFILPLLERVSDLSPEGLATALDALKDSEFIYEQAIYPEVEYTFKHALTQEVAAQGLLAERRGYAVDVDVRHRPSTAGRSAPCVPCTAGTPRRNRMRPSPSPRAPR